MVAAHPFPSTPIAFQEKKTDIEVFSHLSLK